MEAFGHMCGTEGINVNFDDSATALSPFGPTFFSAPFLFASFFVDIGVRGAGGALFRG